MDSEIALSAADVKKRYNLHTIDAIIYASSQFKETTLITGDQHFKGPPNVEII